MQLSIIVPTYNEAPNIAELVRRVTTEADGIEAEIIFVDDSTDATPDVVREVAASAALPVRVGGGGREGRWWWGVGSGFPASCRWSWSPLRGRAHQCVGCAGCCLRTV